MPPQQEWDHALREAAGWVRDFCAPCYGPHGGAKLVVGAGAPAVVRSAARALREADPAHPLSKPYVELGRRVQQSVGDGGTTAVMLCAALVEEGLHAQGRGLRRGALLAGLLTAHRQSRAVLASMATPCKPVAAMATVGPEPWAALVLERAPTLARNGTLDLDAVEIKGHRNGPAWLDGVLASGARARKRSGSGGVLLVERGWKVKPEADIVVRDPAGALAWEAARRARVLDHLEGLGVQLVLVAGAVDEELRDVLASRALIWDNVSKASLKRLGSCTGATPVARPEDAMARDVGQASWRREGDDWIISGKGASATLLLAGSTDAARGEAEQVGEKLLRAAGAVLADPRGVPGNGAWQHDIATSLRRGAHAAPGMTSLAWTAAADALDSLADALVRNAGLDPFDKPTLVAATDGYPWAKAALDGAFETAISILRVDAMFERQLSNAAGLRGGGTPKSAREMAGDIPPDM